MTASQHGRRAEELIIEAREAAKSGGDDAADRYARTIAEAQVHATLALTADDSRSRSGWYGFLVLLVSGFFAGLSIFAYNGLSHWHRPVTLAASANNLGVLQDVKLSTVNNSQVGWVQQGVVRQLVVSGPGQGTAEVKLPMPETECQAMAAKLDTSCAAGSSGRQLSISNPVTFTWSRPQVVSSTGGQPLAAAGLYIASSLARPGALGVTVSAQTSASPSLCFEAPSDVTTLTVTSGLRQFTYSGPWLTTCATGISDVGISILVALPGNGMPPAFEFDGITTLALCAWAPEGTLEGFAGQINLGPGGTTVLGSPTAVSLRSREAKPLLVSLDIGPNSQLGAPSYCGPGPAAAPPHCAPASSGSLAVCTNAATSVITDSGQLVPAEWARDSPVLVPLLGGFVAALVFAPLGVSVQVFMDALKRLRWRTFMDALKRLSGLFRRRDRRAANKNTEGNKNTEVRN